MHIPDDIHILYHLTTRPNPKLQLYSNEDLTASNSTKIFARWKIRNWNIDSWIEWILVHSTKENWIINFSSVIYIRVFSMPGKLRRIQFLLNWYFARYWSLKLLKSCASSVCGLLRCHALVAVTKLSLLNVALAHHHWHVQGDERFLATKR